MPQMRIKQFFEAPRATRTSRRSQVKQKTYEDLVMQVPEGQVGELEPDPGENTRSVKVSLRNAAKRLGIPIEVWDSGGLVYVRKGGRPAAVRMPAAKDIHQGPVDSREPLLPISFEEEEDGDSDSAGAERGLP